MATKIITDMTDDLTGKKLDESKKAMSLDILTLVNDTRSINVTITIPEGVDVDRDALFRAIGNQAAKVTRAPKGSSTTPSEPPAEPTGNGPGRNGRKGQAEDAAPAEPVTA